MRWVVIVFVAGCGRIGFDALGGDDVLTTGEWRMASIGYDRACAITNSGELWCWGNHQPLTQIGIRSDWVGVSSKSHHCGITDDAALWCWGVNNNAQLGTGEVGGELADPTRIGTARWKEVATGSAFTCGIQVDDSLWCWGTATKGFELGLGMNPPQAVVPTRVGTQTGWHDLDIQHHSACALRGTDAYCWGENASSKLGTSDTDTTSVPIPTLVIGSHAWQHIYLGGTHACGIDTNDVGWCWGSSSAGQLGVPDVASKSELPGTWRSFAVDYSHTCGVRLDSSAWCWGDNRAGQFGIPQAVDMPITPVMEPRPIARMNVGDGTTTWITTDGELHVAGRNNGSLLGYNASSRDLVQTGTERWSSISLFLHGCGITTANEVQCWGENATVGDGSSLPAVLPRPLVQQFTQVEAGENFTMALDTADRIWAWGDVPQVGYHSLPELITAPARADVISVGSRSWCAIDNMALWCGGNNEAGQLGDGTTNTYPNAINVGGNAFTAVAVGRSHACGLVSGAQPMCWGSNVQGQLGRGTQDPSPCDPADPDTCQSMTGIPNPMGFVVNTTGSWTDISASKFATCISNVTTTQCWGDNTIHQVLGLLGPDQPIPTTLPAPFLRVVMGDQHACGFNPGGGMWCWGHRNEQGGDFLGLTQIPGSWTDYAGGDHVGCALDGTGYRWCWGQGELGQFGDGRAWTSTPIRFMRP